MGQRNSIDNIKRKQNQAKIDIHHKKLDNYIQFIEARKQQCNSRFQTNAMDHLVNIGPQQWWHETICLIEHQLDQINIKPQALITIERIKDFLETSSPIKYVRTFNNKCYLEYFSLLQVQPVQQKSTVKQTHVSQDRVQGLLRDFFHQNNLESSAPLNPSNYQSAIGQQFNNTSFILKDQIRQNKIEQKKRSQNFIFPLIEKEIDSNDHIVSDIIKQFDIIIQEKYQDQIIHQKTYQSSDQQQRNLCNPRINCTILIQEIKFMEGFLQKLINKLYKDIIDAKSTLKQNTKDQILHEIVLKALFKNTILHDFLISLCEAEVSDQIRDIQVSINIKKYQKISDLEIKDIFMLPLESRPYHQVIDHLYLIEITKCPVIKFELIAKLKDIICDCIDDYYDNYPHPTHSNVQKQIEADTFLSILIFCIAKSGNASILAHTKLIDMILPSTIAYEFEESSWVWISLCGAIEILQNEYKGDNIKQQYDNCISTVIKQKLTKDAVRSQSVYV